MFTSFYIITSVIYLFFENPGISLVTNFIFLLAIALSYEIRIFKALLFTMMMLLIAMALEAIIYFTTISNHITSLSVPAKYNLVYGQILLNVTFYVLARIYNTIRVSRRKNMFIKSFWASIIIVPFGSFFFLYTSFQNENISDSFFVVVSVIVLLMNFIIFAIYEELNKYYEVMQKERSLQQLNSSFEQQLDVMKLHIISKRALQHDFKSHLYNIRTYIDANQNENAKTYLRKLEEESNLYNHGIKTGNLVVDSIINYEFGKVDLESISLHMDIDDLPETLSVHDYDLTIIVSNLLRNALDAITKVENKKINLSIKYDKGILKIGLRNSFDGIILKDGNRFISSKKQEHHGIGLSNVEDAVERYKGDIRIEHDGEFFSVKILMYI